MTERLTDQEVKDMEAALPRLADGGVWVWRDGVWWDKCPQGRYRRFLAADAIGRPLSPALVVSTQGRLEVPGDLLARGLEKGDEMWAVFECDTFAAACAKLREVVKPRVLAEEAKPEPAPSPAVFACEMSGYVLTGGDECRVDNDCWRRLDRWKSPLTGNGAHYSYDPPQPLRLCGKMGAAGKIIPIGRLCPNTDTPHYTPLTPDECAEFGLSPLCRDYDGVPHPYTPPATEPAPTTGVKHDADKPAWWLMPWSAVKRVADNGALSTIFRAYADAAGRTCDAFAWAQLGHTIIARKLGESPYVGIDDATMWAAFEQVHKVLEYGAAKYEARNWQLVLQGPNGPQRYVEACRRHLMADAAGEELDAESGLPHWTHALCCCLFLIYNAEEHAAAVAEEEAKK